MKQPNHQREARQIAPGFILAIALGMGIWFLSSRVTWIDPLVAGIVGGMLLRAVIGERAQLSPGFEWTPSVLIPPGIILYAAHLRFDTTVVTPLIWFQLLIGLIVAIWTARSIGNWLGLRDATALLLGVGTAICGASAIVIAKDAVEARSRDTATALVVVTIWGLLGLTVMPHIAHYLKMTVNEQALLYATTLQQTGLVKAAALGVSTTCLNAAMAIKSARIIGIIPLLLIAGTLHHLPQLTASQKARKEYNVKIAWYLWAFIAAGLLFNIVPPLASTIPTCKLINAIIWTMAMASIGLSINLKDIFAQFGRALLAGLIIWLGVITVFAYTYITLRS